MNVLNWECKSIFCFFVILIFTQFYFLWLINPVLLIL